MKLGEQDGLFPALHYDPLGTGLMAVVAPFRSGALLEWEGTLLIGEDVVAHKGAHVVWHQVLLGYERA